MQTGRNTKTQKGSILIGVLVLGMVLSVMGGAVLLMAGNTSNQIAAARVDRKQVQATESAIRLVAGWIRVLGTFPASNPNINLGPVNDVPIQVGIQQNGANKGLVIATAILPTPTAAEPIRFAPVARCSVQIRPGVGYSEDTVRTFRCRDSVMVTTFP